jgi:hypothetical protein
MNPDHRNPDAPHSPKPTDNEELLILWRIISRHNWDTLQSTHKACPGSTIEHLYAGMYVLTIPAGGACGRARRSA